MDARNSESPMSSFGEPGLEPPNFPSPTTPVRTSPSILPLCANCRAFGFDHIRSSLIMYSREERTCYHKVPVSSQPMHYSSIWLRLTAGSKAEVVSSSATCPFCALISQAIDEGQRLLPRFNKSIAEDNLSDSLVLRSTGNCRGGIAIDVSPSYRGHILLCFSFRNDADEREAKPSVRVEQQSGVARICPYLRARHGSQIDYEQILHWVRTCVASHPNCRVLYQGPEAETIGASVVRFIDVSQLCIVSYAGSELQTKPREYVALSYVWGTAVNLSLTTRNKSEMMTPGVLGRIWGMIPRTIRDAITLVQRLGLQLLWVDALCLMQNDPQDVEEGVEFMDLVYERALFTIVSACGHDADAALPGVMERSKPAPRVPLPLEGGLQVELHLDLDALLGNTAYRSRAWTYVNELPRHPLKHRLTHLSSYWSCANLSITLYVADSKRSFSPAAFSTSWIRRYTSVAAEASAPNYLTPISSQPQSHSAPHCLVTRELTTIASYLNTSSQRYFTTPVELSATSKMPSERFKVFFAVSAMR